MGTVEQRLAELGITLPTPAPPVANYVPTVRTGNLVVVSGQICFGLDGKLADAHKGKLGAEVAMEAGQEAARLCAINVLAQLRSAIGDLDQARSATDELTLIAARFHSKALVAGATLAAGRVRLADGDAAGAETSLSEAARLWNEIGAPYEAAPRTHRPGRCPGRAR